MDSNRTLNGTRREVVQMVQERATGTVVFVYHAETDN